VVPGLAAACLVTLRLVRVRLPLRRPHVTAHGTEAIRDVVLASWTRPDGARGWGECPTLSTFGYSDEITDTAWGFLRDVVGPIVVDTGALPRVEGSPMAMAAVRDAMLDARLRADDRSLWEWVGGMWRPLETTTVIGIGAAVPDTTGLGEGWLKVKITPETTDSLRELRDRHPDLRLAADANGSFASPDDVPGWIDDLDLAYLEQPLPPDDLAGSAALRSRLRTPIALDESITDARTFGRALHHGSLDVVSLKPARVGGVEAAVELLTTARDAGIEVFVGGMLETCIGRAAAVALATASGVTLPTDLGPSSRYFDHDLARPIEVDEAGKLVPPDGPGIGRTPDEERLAAVTVDEAEFRTA
jgi:o-succinylbenzoate synthase